MEATDTGSGGGIGERLQRAREQRGLAIEECAERLFLPVSVLNALEREAFAELGASIYVRSHLRRYAGLLEVDAAELEQRLVQQMVAMPDLTAIVTRRVGNPKPGRRLGLLPVAIVAVVLALAVLVWWSSRQPSEPVLLSVPVPLNQGEPAAPAVAPDKTVVEPAPAPAPLPRTAPAPASSGTRDDGMSAARQPVELPQGVATVAPASRPPAAAGAAAGKPAASAASSSAASVAPRRVETPPVVEAPPRETRSDYMNFDF